MPNFSISDLPLATLPLDLPNTFFELQTVEGGIAVSRKLQASNLSVASGITVQDEGTPLPPLATTLNFVGAGVTASGAGATKTITIPGGGGTTVNPGTVEGQMLRWDNAGSEYDPTSNLIADEIAFELVSLYTYVGEAGMALRNANGDVFIDNSFLGGGQYQYSVNLGNDAIRIRDDGLALFGMSGGTQNTTLQSGAEVDIVRNGVDQVALTVAPASGGLQVNNLSTGAGLERVLTTSDLGGAGITIQDEGTPLATLATTLNFVGAGVTATGAGATKTITIPGGAGVVTQLEDGSGNVRFIALPSNIAALRGDASVDNDSKMLQIQHQDGTLRALFGYPFVSGFLNIQNRINGSPVQIRANDGGGTTRLLSEFHPADSANRTFGIFDPVTGVENFGVFEVGELGVGGSARLRNGQNVLVPCGYNSTFPQDLSGAYTFNQDRMGLSLYGIDALAVTWTLPVGTGEPIGGWWDVTNPSGGTIDLAPAATMTLRFYEQDGTITSVTNPATITLPVGFKGRVTKYSTTEYHLYELAGTTGGGGSIPDPLILNSIHLQSALTPATGSPYQNVPINIGANLTGTMGMTQLARQRIQARPSSFSFNATLFIQIDGGDCIIGDLNGANLTVERGVSVQMQHTGSSQVIAQTVANGLELPIDGTLFIDERATAAASVATDGQIWVRNDSPNTLMFTNDAGQDFGVFPEFVEQTSDTTVNNSTTLVNTQLTFTDIPVGFYRIDGMFLARDVGVTGCGLRIDCSITGADPDSVARLSNKNFSGAGAPSFDEIGLAPDLFDGIGLVTGSGTSRFMFTGYVEFISGTNTFTVQFAQNTAQVGDLDFEAGSFLSLTKLGQ